MSPLVGTGALVRLALRRDRAVLPPWILFIAVATIGTAAAFAKLYPTPPSRMLFSVSIAHNAALRALIGPPFDLSSIGGLTAWRIGGVGAVLAALMSLFTVVRHTRAEEEAGRLELVGACVVGRHAPLAAGLAVAFGANLALALVTAAGLIALGLPIAGAIALGSALASAGWVLAAIAAVAAQVTAHARVANGIAASVLGVSFLLRAAGDAAGEAGPSWLSWLSPIGWTQQIRPFAGDRWWVLALTAAFGVALAGVAHALVTRRDVGAGLLPPRLGAVEAASWLRGPVALAWRLQRGALLGWTVGFAVGGAALGSVADGVADIANSSPQLQQIVSMMGGKLRIVDSFFAAIMGMLGLVASAYAIQATLRLRSEETGQRAEPVLATAVGRTRWALSHVAFAAGGPAILLAAAGLAAGVSYGLRAGDVGARLPGLLAAAVVQLPAAWVLVGIAVALFGLAPRLALASWAVLLGFFLLGQLGPLLRLDPWAMGLSPFTHVPKLPTDALTPAPIAGLAAVAAALTTSGLLGFRRRDLG